MELADQTVAAAQQSVTRARVCCRIGKSGNSDRAIRTSEAAVSVRRFDRRPVNNETEQQKRKHARKRSVPLN
jgi:hypothetical protein